MSTTPRPWKVVEKPDRYWIVNSDGLFVADSRPKESKTSRADVNLIVRAVNEYDELVAHNKAMRELLQDALFDLENCSEFVRLIVRQ